MSVKKLLDTPTNRKRTASLKKSAKERAESHLKTAKKLGFSSANEAYKELGGKFIQICKQSGCTSINEAMKKEEKPTGFLF